MIGWFTIACLFMVVGVFLWLHRWLREPGPCRSVYPDTGATCTLEGRHSLHVAQGAAWTDQDVRDAKDPKKALILELRKTRAAMERIAGAIEHHTGELLHKVR